VTVPALGQKVALAATVTPIAWTTKATTGTKTFCDGAAPLGTVAVTAFFGRPRLGAAWTSVSREAGSVVTRRSAVIGCSPTIAASWPNSRTRAAKQGSLRSTAPRDLHPSEEAVAWSAHG